LISIIHPSRQRPEKSFAATRKWLNHASQQGHELIVSIDDNDPTRGEYIRLYSQYSPFSTRIISNPNRSAVDAINNAAKVARGDIFIVVSDDTDTLNRWDDVILAAVAGRSDYVLRVADGIQEWLVTMPIMDRIYYNRFGYIYYPEFRHMFVDTHLTHVADALKRIIWRPDIRIDHLHYSIRRSVKDEVSTRADATTREGMQLYLDLLRKNLLLDPAVNIWDLSPNAKGHLNWLKQQMPVPVH
jgi:glycosyltransferase involved in cell wall biosynthesis